MNQKIFKIVFHFKMLYWVTFSFGVGDGHFDDT